jgi:hypothetical protein
MSEASEFARRFGAKVQVSPPKTTDRQLFFVRGSGGERLEGIIRAAGGRPVLRAPGWVLAEISLPQAMALKTVNGVRSISGVNIDPKRFEFFQQVIRTRGATLPATTSEST